MLQMPLASPLLLLVLLLALAVPAPAGAIGWPFGWGNGGRGEQQQQGAASASSVDACEAALLMGGTAGEGGNKASVEERVLSSSSDKGQGQKPKMATFQARRKHTADVEGAVFFMFVYVWRIGSDRDLLVASRLPPLTPTVRTLKKDSNSGGAGAAAVNEKLWHAYLASEASKAPILNAQNWTQVRKGCFIGVCGWGCIYIYRHMHVWMNDYPSECPHALPLPKFRPQHTHTLTHTYVCLLSPPI
jgi:hypothetical protein